MTIQIAAGGLTYKQLIAALNPPPTAEDIEREWFGDPDEL